jgi:hypothetical protein
LYVKTETLFVIIAKPLQLEVRLVGFCEQGRQREVVSSSTPALTLSFVVA